MAVLPGGCLIELAILLKILEAPPGFEPGMEVLQFGTLVLLPKDFDDLLRILIGTWCPVVLSEAGSCQGSYTLATLFPP